MSLNDEGQLDGLLRSGLLADRILQLEAARAELKGQRLALFRLALEEVARLRNGGAAAASPKIAASAVDDLRLYHEALPIFVSIQKNNPATDLHKQVIALLERISQELRQAVEAGRIPKEGLPTAHKFFAAWAVETLHRSGDFFEERTDVNPWQQTPALLRGSYSA